MKRTFIILAIMVISIIFVSGVALADGDATAGAGATSDLSLTQNGSDVPINMVPQDLKFPQLIPYFGPENPGWRFRPLQDILLYGNQFIIGSLQSAFTDKTLRDEGLERVTDEKVLKEIITVIYTGVKNIPDTRYRRKGYVGAKAVNGCTSLHAFKMCLLKANKVGAKVVHMTRQGVDFSMEATGYGASLGGVTATLSESQQSGAISSGMLGWAKGKAEANKDPWVQGVALVPVP